MPPPLNRRCLHLDVLRPSFSIIKYPPTDKIPVDALRELSASKTTSGLASITRTAEEISIICEMDEVQGEWKCIKVVGPIKIEMAQKGVICNLVTPLKNAGIPPFVISTWETDYLLVPKEMIVDAVEALSTDGWRFVAGSSIHP